MVAVDREGQNPLEFRQGQAGSRIGLALAAFRDAAPGRAAQLMHHAHHRADQPFNRSVLFGMAFGTDFGVDPIAAQPALDAARLILRSLVIFENGRPAPDRPTDPRQIPPSQPFVLGQTDMRQACRDGQCRGRLEGHRETQHRAAEHIDGECHVGASNHLAITSGDEQDIAGGAVDLNPLPRRLGPV